MKERYEWRENLSVKIDTVPAVKETYFIHTRWLSAEPLCWLFEFHQSFSCSQTCGRTIATS